MSLKKKIANILGLNIINKCSSNIAKIEPSINLVYLSGKNIKEKASILNKKYDSFYYSNKNNEKEKIKK